MSCFREKVTEIKKNTPKNGTSIRHVCSANDLRMQTIPNSPRQQLCIQQPIIIHKKTKKEKVKDDKIKRVKSVKHVEPFVPIQIPKSPPSGHSKNISKMFDNTKECTPTNRQIEIHIEKDNKNDKQCLKKLFKKIHKLTEDLKASEKARNKLQVELKNLQQIDGFNRGLEKDLVRLEGQNYKLGGQIDLLKRQLKQRQNEINHLKNKTPQQIVKEIVVEKPIQVPVQVPKYVQGAQKIIQVPKYIDNPTVIQEVERGRKKIEWLQAQLQRQRERGRQIQDRNSVPAIVEKPVYLQKPIYIQKPVYIDKPIQRQRTIEIPVQVPIQVPVYIDKPVIDEQMISKMAELQKQVVGLVKENEQIKYENNHLKVIINQLYQNIQILKKHNEQKNYEVESLLHNIDDYEPMKTINIKREQVNQRTCLHNADTFNPTLY